jgi:hypothetical protein
LNTIDFIIAALDTGMAARIMSGRQVTGHFGPVSVPPRGARYLTLVSSCGSMGVTSRKDTKPLRLAPRRHVSRLPSRDQSTRQTEKRADERFPKIMAPYIQARPENKQSQRETYRADDRIVCFHKEVSEPRH